MAANVYPLKKRASDADVHLVHARIIEDRDGTFLVEHPGCNAARRALSCLIEPRADDLVLLALDSTGGQAHILAVLERPGSQDADLALPGGGAIHTRDGDVRIGARSLQLDAREGLALNTGQLDIAAISASATVKHWQGWFDTLETNAVSIEYTAKTLSSKVGRLLSRALESFRSVEGLDETRVGRSRTRVREDHRLEAGHINARAEGFVKIDGQKIDLG